MVAPSDAGAARAARPHPVVQLTLMRLREFTREPGVLFWAFGFPLLIALALGFAFRVRRPEPPVVGTLPGLPPAVTAALGAAGVRVKPLDEAAARVELRAGRVDLLVAPAAEGGASAVSYRFDAMRP